MLKSMNLKTKEKDNEKQVLDFILILQKLKHIFKK